MYTHTYNTVHGLHISIMVKCLDVIFTATYRYIGGKSSNMALVDVEIPSGYTFSQYEFEDDIVSTYSLHATIGMATLSLCDACPIVR